MATKPRSLGFHLRRYRNRELDLAIRHEIPLVPIALDDAPLTAGIEYQLSTTHTARLDGRASIANLEKRIEELAGVVRPIMEEADLAGVRAELPAVHPTPRLRRSVSFAGRAGDRRALQQRIDALSASRIGGVLMIAGESGSGKSALVDDLVDRAQPAGCTVCHTTCGQLNESMPFYAIRELMRQFVDDNDVQSHIQRLFGPNSTQASMAAVIDSPSAEPQARREAITSVDWKLGAPRLTMANGLDLSTKGPVN